MISFANYVLSKERTDSVLNNPITSENPEQTEERLNQVSHADFENWRKNNKKKK